MLSLSFGLCLIAALLGCALAAWHLPTAKATPPRWPLGVLHGALGVLGFITLLLALRGPPRGESMGVSAFGRIAATLLGMALLAGFAIVVVRLRGRRVPGSVIGIHASIAVSGVVMLAAYVLVG